MGLELSSTDKVEKIKKIFLVLVFPWDLLTLSPTLSELHVS